MHMLFVSGVWLRTKFKEIHGSLTEIDENLYKFSVALKIYVFLGRNAQGMIDYDLI